MEIRIQEQESLTLQKTFLLVQVGNKIVWFTYDGNITEWKNCTEEIVNSYNRVYPGTSKQPKTIQNPFCFK